MQLWQDALVAFLAAIGLSSLLWMTVRAVLSAPVPHRQDGVLLLPARGDGQDLEAEVRALRRLRYEQGVFGTLLLVDCGLTEEGQKLCVLLAREDRWTKLCEKSDIETYLT